MNASVREYTGRQVPVATVAGDENNNSIEASFVIDASKTDSLSAFKSEVEKYGDSVRVSFIESKSF